MNHRCLLSKEETRVAELPASTAELLPGVAWGEVDCLFTPAFWASQVRAESESGYFCSHRLGESLREEVVACLLGGYGIPAEVGLAAFQRLKSAGLLEHGASAAAIRRALSKPLMVNERSIRYRFASTKSDFLSRTLAILDHDEPSSNLSDRAYRDWLAQLPGVGLKTASWITRNVRDSDEVAILDIHVVRACTIARVFSVGDTVPRHYRKLEDRFVAFARALGVRASSLDAVMWDFMRRAGPLALSALRAA